MPVATYFCETQDPKQPIMHISQLVFSLTGLTFVVTAVTAGPVDRRAASMQECNPWPVNKPRTSEPYAPPYCPATACGCHCGPLAPGILLLIFVLGHSGFDFLETLLAGGVDNQESDSEGDVEQRDIEARSVASLIFLPPSRTSSHAHLPVPPHLQHANPRANAP